MFRTGSPARTFAAQDPPITIAGRGDRARPRRRARFAKIATNCGPRMAGMRPFVLCEEFASAYYDPLAAADCPSSQIAIDKLSAVPLWKVIVGSRRLTANRARKGPVFFFHWRAPAASAFTFSRAAVSRSDVRASAAKGYERRNRDTDSCPKNSRRRLQNRLGQSILVILVIEKDLGRTTMAWTTPTLVEICIGLEINGYLPAEF